MKRFLTFSLSGPAIGGLVLFHVITLSGNTVGDLFVVDG